MKQNNISITEYPAPDSLSTEIQVIADIISLPGTLVEAERLISAEMFTDDRCRDAFVALKAMAKDGMTIDLPSVFGRIDRGLIQNGVVPMMVNAGGVVTTIQHYSTLRDYHIKRKCYHKAIELLINATGTTVTAQDLIGWAGSFADNLRRDVDLGRGIQHISTVINDLGEQIQEKVKEKEKGKALRVPTGFYTLDRLTYSGYNSGNLVVLAARPSVGKTAVMLQMARASASSGKTVNIFSLEMTNTELAQRFLCATEKITPSQMARADVDWQMFELASSEYSSKPVYLSDSLFGEDEIISNITLNVQSGKCDIAFIDYLGLVSFADTRAMLDKAIAGFTKRLKKLAKSCKIPIVLLCQLNRASASEKRPPQLYDLRDSGSIEQDADIVLMLERVAESSDGRDVNMWVRKNRQGSAGEVKVEIRGNDTFTAFEDMNEPPPPPAPEWNDDFKNDSDFPF